MARNVRGSPWGRSSRSSPRSMERRPWWSTLSSVSSTTLSSSFWYGRSALRELVCFPCLRDGYSCGNIAADAFESSTAKVEHWVVSTFTSVIPESIRVKARGYWDAFKSKTQKDLGEEAGETVEMAGWGVEEAQERHDEEASSFDLSPVGNHFAMMLRVQC